MSPNRCTIPSPPYSYFYLCQGGKRKNIDKIKLQLACLNSGYNKIRNWEFRIFFQTKKLEGIRGRTTVNSSSHVSLVFLSRPVESSLKAEIVSIHLCIYRKSIQTMSCQYQVFQKHPLMNDINSSDEAL